MDRHLDQLTRDGTLKKLSQGLYYAPEQTAFGETPPNEEILIRSFLNDDRFLLTSPNVYNSLGVGTTQLYNQRTVYNFKRHGHFRLGHRNFVFRIKPHFPKNATPEFLLVDLVNNLDSLAEDQSTVLKNVFSKVAGMDGKKFRDAILEYGNVKTRKLMDAFLSVSEVSRHAG